VSEMPIPKSIIRVTNDEIAEVSRMVAADIQSQYPKVDYLSTTVAISVTAAMKIVFKTEK